MPRGPKGAKHPADVIGNAVHVMRIATGEIEPRSHQGRPAAGNPRNPRVCCGPGRESRFPQRVRGTAWLAPWIAKSPGCPDAAGEGDEPGGCRCGRWKSRFAAVISPDLARPNFGMGAPKRPGGAALTVPRKRKETPAQGAQLSERQPSQ
jgi:hypothetical protein